MPPSSSEFSVSYDLTTRILTAIFVIASLAVAAFVHVPFVGTLMIFITIAGFAYSPRGYSIACSILTVKRLAGSVKVPLVNVRELRRVNKDDLRGTIRLFGSGGFFGYYGLFRTARFGKCTWYVTNRKNMLVLVTDSGTTLYSPDDVDRFLGAVRIAPSLNEPSVVPKPSFHLGKLAGFLVVTMLLLVSLLSIFFAVTYEPGAPSYSLTSSSLEIKDRFYPVTVKADSIDLADIRVVDLNMEDGWRPMQRTNGFSNSHYRSGWFKVKNGQSVRLYQGDKMRLVLLAPSGDGNPILLEANNPEKFVEELKGEWKRR